MKNTEVKEKLFSNVYGYARVSSKKQAKDGNSLEAQEQTIHERYPGCKVWKEAYTGSKTNRKVFNEVLGNLKAGDILVVTKLDRFCRNTKEGLECIEKLLGQGISVHILNMGLIDNSPTGKLILTIMLAFAEFERSMILERTSEGKEIARQKEGYRDGRPKKFNKKQLDLAMKLLLENSYKQVEAMTGISVSTLIREKRKEKIREMKEIA